MKARGFVLLMLTATPCLFGQVGEWPTYNGDYSGRRFSPLTQINTGNVHNLALAWMTRLTDTITGAGARVSSTPLVVDGVMYLTALDNAWALDPLTGRQIWHYSRESKGDMPRTGNRGFGMYGKWLYFLSIDNYLVCLDSTNGKERWAVQIADARQYYFSTMAPVVIGKHVIISSGGDSLDIRGFVEARDPETGASQWKWMATPDKGDPASSTWTDEYSAIHGGGNPWVSGTYDPQLNLYYAGTGNPTPVHGGQSRQGDNLWTDSIVALNPDTGKLVWYFQPMPHDTHDWDSVQTPILIDGVIGGKPRKLLAQANRNGYFVVLDRTNGKSVLTKPYVENLNWAKGVNAQGQPIRDPAKDPTPDGTIVSPSSSGITNWPPPSFSPATGLFYVTTIQPISVFYLTDTDDNPQGYAGKEASLGALPSALRAIDYRTGVIRWKHEWPGPASGGVSGILSTAGNVLFTSNAMNMIAFDARNGDILWHAGLLAGVSNGPMTYVLNGKQYVFVAAGEYLYAFAINKPFVRTAGGK